MFSQSELEKFRDHTEGCRHVVHLNNAGASLMTNQVTSSIIEHIKLEQQIGGYESAVVAAESIAEFYQVAGDLFHCSSRNIAYTCSATDSFSRALSSIPFRENDVILTTNEDYSSNQIMYLSLAKRMKVRVIRCRTSTQGGCDLDDLEVCIKKYKPRLVAVTHIPTYSGLVQPVNEIGTLCRDNDTLFLLDACQSIGQLDLNVHELKCDYLSVTSRKFLRGPRGAGFLYVSDKVLSCGLEPLFIDMRGAIWNAPSEFKAMNDAKRFEDWEFAYALLLGTATSIKYLLQLDIKKIQSYVWKLADDLRLKLSAIPGVTVLDHGLQLSAIVTFYAKDFPASDLQVELHHRKINVSLVSQTSATIDYLARGIDSAIRVSPHYFNTAEEMETFTSTLVRILTRKKL